MHSELPGCLATKTRLLCMTDELLSWQFTLHQWCVNRPINRVSIPVTPPCPAVYVQTCVMKASKYIAEWTSFWPQSWSLRCQDRALKPVWQLPEKATLHSLECCLYLHVWTDFVMASRCTSTVTISWPQSLWETSLDHSLWVHLWVHWIMGLEGISTFPRLQLPSVFQSWPLNLHLHGF